jgi:hypothetical protein
MKLRTFLQTSLVALLVAMTGLVSAQESDCLNLSAEDCAYLNTAAANTTAALTSSFQEAFTIDLNISGIPESDDVVLHVDGNGPVVANEDAPGGVPLDFAATINITANDGKTDSNTTLEARLVDGVFYFQDPSDDNKWKGVKIEDAMSAAEDNPMVPNPTTFDPASLGLDEETMNSIMDLTKTEGFLDYSRDGETFTFTADVGALLKSSEWTNFTTEIAPKLQQNPDTAQAAMMLGVLPMLLSDGTIKVVQVVDPSINAVTELSVLIDGTVNAGMMSGDSSAKPVVLSFNFNVKVSDVGGSFTIEAPADAEIQEMPATSN